jgi:acyl carrier protein
MEDRIRRVMSAILELDPESISSETSVESVDQWDSIRQMSLVMALEEEFEIEFDESDISSLLSYGSIVKTVKKYSNS